MPVFERSRTWSLAVLLLGVAACGTHVSVVRLAPAEVNVPAGKRVAIGGVRGQEGDSIVDDLTQALVETQRFEVLDRQHLNAIMKEQNFGVSGFVSDDSAVSVGQLTGAAALIVGDVLTADYREDLNHVTDKCAKDGKLVDCVKYTRRGQAELRVALKVLETETGKVLAAKTLGAQGARSAESIDSPPAPLNARENLLADCRRTIASDFAKVIAPHPVHLSVTLADDSDLPELQMGNNYAKLGNWNEAITQYTTAVSHADTNAELSPKVRAKAHYDLGVGLGYSGRYDDGVKEIEQAFALNPDDSYRQQVEVIRQFKADDAKLAEQQKTGGS